MSNNETVHEYKIKYRGDGVYDLYVDKTLMASKGSVESVVNELKVIMAEINDYKLKGE